MHDYRYFKATEPAEFKKVIVDLHKKQQQYSFEIELLREQVSGSSDSSVLFVIAQYQGLEDELKD